MFLTKKEVAELTGIYRGNGTKTNYEMQAAQLRKMGIPFWVNALGVPKVAAANLVGSSTTVKAAEPEKRWVPSPRM